MATRSTTAPSTATRTRRKGSATISTSLATQISPDALFPSHCNYNQPGSASPLNATQSSEDADCENLAFNFAMGVENPPSDWNQSLSAFPARYFVPGGSVVNGVVRPPASPFGGVFHSTPAIQTPPNALLRDDSYQAYIQNYATSYTTSNSIPEPRHTVLYVATIDGLLHAFGVDYDPTGGASSGTGDPYTFIGTSHTSTAGTLGLQNELWSFIPPAVYTKLLGDIGGGENVLLDGAPVVKDTIYQRVNVGTAEDWHSTLVAGFGAAGAGYYALDVTDPDFTQRPSTPVVPTHATSNSGTPAYMDTGALPQGPHFLWQLTDSTIFAPTSGTPAITTIAMKDPDNDDTVEQIGVAILPGGSTAPGSSSVGCTRSTKISDASPASPSAPYPLGPKVRMWTSSGCPTATNPAQGRSLTVVRLDNGEVLRVFAPMTDLPAAFPPYSGVNSTPNGTTGSAPHDFPYIGRVTQADFDSPISGTPVAYPADVGAAAQKIYVGDEDGTVWRLTVSDPDPNHWYVEPLFDAYNGTVATQFGAANAGRLGRRTAADRRRAERVDRPRRERGPQLRHRRRELHRPGVEPELRLLGQ